MKTLKDIMGDGEGECCCNGCQEGWDFCSQKDLRQEAIKWIKKIQKENNIKIELMEDGSLKLDTKPEKYEYGRAIGEIISLIRFFNIEEKDLK